MSSSVNAESAREQRRMEREERRRRRAAQESSKTSLSGEKTPGKEDRRAKRGTDYSSSNGSVSKKPPSGTKRSTMPSYDKVNIVEKTAKFDSVEKENKGKQKMEVSSKPDSSRRKLGSKFLDNLSKFESQGTEEVKKSPFVRSFRTPRTTPGIDDASILTRRSLRKERVLDSIAKLERKSSADGGTSLKKKSSSPSEEKPEEKTKLSSHASSASLSDSGSSVSSTKGMTRAQQALERHKERMRKSSQSNSSPSKPTTPTGKSRQADSRKTPGKSKSRQKLERTPSTEELKTRKISITATPVKDDVIEVTTVTEITTPTEGKLNIIVKEIAASEEESEKLLSPAEGTDYELGDPRPVSVEDTVAKFSAPQSPEQEEAEQPKRIRRKLPEIPTNVPAKEPRRRSRKKKLSEDGSGESSAVTVEEQKVVVIETSPTFSQNSETAKLDEAHSPPSGGDFQFSQNFNENSNSDRKCVQAGVSAFMHDQILRSEAEPVKRVKYEAEAEAQTTDIKDDEANVEAKEEALNRSFTPDEAIEVLRRLSEEVHSQPAATKDMSSVAKTSIVASDIVIEENIVQDQSKSSSDIVFNLEDNFSEERPSSLHIEEVLYITEEADKRERSASPQKHSIEDVDRTPSPSKVRKRSLKAISRESSTSQVCRTLSPEKSSPKSPQKILFDPPKAIIIEHTPEVTSLEQEGRATSPDELPKSLRKTPESPKKSLVRTVTPGQSPRPPTKTPVSPVKLDSPIKSPLIAPETFSFTTESAIETKSPIPDKRSPPPTKDKELKSPTRVRSPSPAEESPTKQEETEPTSPTKIIVEKSPPSYQEQAARSPSHVQSQSPVKKSSEDKMLAARRTIVPRYQKSWLDESDSDDDISLLSDAASDASSIDMDWLGQDASDDEYNAKRGMKPRSGSGGVQRTGSSAQDMLKMWEKKAVEPKHKAESSPSKLSSESTKRVGSMRSAWESKRKSSLHNSSQESIDSSEGKRNGHSQNGSAPQAKPRSSPSTPRHSSARTNSSPGEDSLRSPSGGDFQLRASETETQEMLDIFDDKMSGKIQGAKAIFENLASSPKRSPSLGRSPRHRVDEKRLTSETADDVFPSRKSSISQASESSDVAMPTDSSDLTEDSPSVDNMRAMFEDKKNKKQDAKKHKTSLAEMVAEDDCDITDVRSIKAMWESMDNHR